MRHNASGGIITALDSWHGALEQSASLSADHNIPRCYQTRASKAHVKVLQDLPVLQQSSYVLLVRSCKVDWRGSKRQVCCAAEEAEETGWKYIHGDVFRPPPHLNLFCACVGTGTQMFVLTLCIFGLALIGMYYPYNRGALLTSCVVRACFRSTDCTSPEFLLSGGPALVEMSHLPSPCNSLS